MPLSVGWKLLLDWYMLKFLRRQHRRNGKFSNFGMPKGESSSVMFAREHEIAPRLEDLRNKKDERDICLRTMKVLNAGCYD